MDVSLIECLCFISMAFILDVGNCLQMEQPVCGSSCAASSHHSYKRGVRYTYRYSTAITTTLEGSQSGRNGLALDCAVDIDVISNCHLLMQIRNPQIKRVSPQKEHSVQRLKSLREWLQRSRLKFSLREGKVTALCPQEGGQLWTLNIQRALLSMLQTSRTNTKQETVKETDVYGTCSSKYERRGPVLLKTRDLQQCQQDRLSHFWPHSSTLTDDTTVDAKLQCTQRHGLTVMEEVNCTEVVSLVTLSGSPGVMKTQTVSTLVLLRAQEGTPSGADTLGPGVLTDLQFEVEGAQGPVQARASTSLEASDTVRRLCSLTSDQRQLSELFLHLAFQLRDLSLTQLRGLWQDASFKCRNDWQPLMDALPACGSEECILLLTDLIRDREIEQDQAHSYLSTLGLIPHPTPHIIHSINALLEVPEVRSKALLAGSSLIHLLCLRSPCSHIPQVQSFLLTLENILETDCEEKEPAQLTEVLYALKAVGNAGLTASALTPHLARCAQSPSAALDLRLAAIQAFRRIPCRADRGPLLQLYRSLQEDGEVRIAAYQQLMRCPDQEVFQVVKRTLSRETSSQVGSFVWSHLTHILRTEDPLKQALMEVLPDDIISRDFEAEPWKYSSYFDYTTDSGFGVANIEGSLVFSPKSFVPRSAMANLTVYVHGRAFNLLEVDLRAENIEPFLKRLFGHQPTSSDKQQTNPDREEADSKERKRRRTAEGDEEGIKDRRKSNDYDGESQGGTDCLSSMYHYLDQARTMFAVGKPEENRPRCWVGVKWFGNELTMLTCDDLYSQVKQLSLNLAGMAVKMLKGQEVQLNHRAVLLTEEMVLPSLSGLPLRLSINMTSLLSLRLKGSANYRDPAHFSLAGYIKPNAYVGLSARVGVEGALGAAGVEWAAELRTSSSLNGSIYLQDGQSLRVTLNTPEDLMEVISLSSRLFHTSGDHREEIKGPKSRVEKTTCTPPKTWSKMVGWQLCSNMSYPISPMGISLPPPGPAHLSLRFLKLDRGLHQYLLEASYSIIHQRGSWLPSEASLHLLMATPQSTIPRDISLDLGLSPQRLVLKLTHPQKTIYIQGQLDQVRNMQTVQLDLLIDNVNHYYIMGLIDTQTVQLEQRLRYYLEAKMSPDGRPMILSANVTRGLGRKTSLSAALKNVFKETASFSVVLERRMDEERRQYSVEAELLLPGVVGSRILGLMEQKGPRWSSAVRLKYGLSEESRHLHQECYTSQILRTDRDANQTYSVRAEHEFYCSNTASVNHKVLLRHEESPSHTRSSLDISYGKHWDEINNKRRLLISQSFRNQSRHTLTSYALEFSFQLPEKHLNYKTQLLHSHLRQRGAESSTHLKVNYNDQMPLVAGLHWKDASKATLRKLEATFNMDTPWLYIYTTHKLSQPQRHTLQLTSELTARKWLTIRSLVLEGLYMARSKEREARLHLYTPALTYLKARGWGMMGKQGLKASCSMSSLWSPGLRGDLSLETTKHSHALQMASAYGKHNLTLTAALNTVDKNLRKRLVMVKVVFSEPKSPPMELEFEVGVEELLKEKMMYQKRAMLLIRQPFQNFLQNLQIQETFTVDLHKGLYILESKASLPGKREAIHTLTFGYQQPRLFVCSSLTHPFSSHTIPADSEVCVTVSSNQTQREVQGRVRVGRKNKLTFLGQVQSNPLDSPQHGLRVKASLSQLFQLQLPSSVIMEGDVSWNTDINSGFDYLARGKVGLGRQLCQFSMQFNGSSDTVGLYSSLSHPFKSKIPKTLEAQATAALFDPNGRASSTLHVRADGKDRAVLEAQLAHSLKGGTTALGLHVNLTQSLLPTAAKLFLNMSANISSHSLSMLGSYRQGMEEMLAQVSGSLEHTPGLQVAVSGDLRHSLPSLAALPPALGLDGALGQSDTLTEGQLRVRVGEAVYSVELNHQEAPKDFQEAEEGTLGNELDGAHDWLCARAGEESLCLNISRNLRDQGRVRAQLSHASSWLHASGIPGNSSGQVSWTQEESRLAVLAELQAGSEALTAEFEGGRRDLAGPQWELYSRLQHKIKALVQRGFPSSVQANAHYKMEIQEVSAGLSIHVENQRKVDILVTGGRSNSTADLALSLWQQLRLLKGLVPSSLQMNCTGGVAEDRLSAQCSGSVAGQPMETLLPSQISMNASLLHAACSTRLDTHLYAGDEEQGFLSLATSCHPHLSLKGSARHSLGALRTLGVPPRGALVLALSTEGRPGVELGLELGPCYTRASAGEKGGSEIRTDHSTWFVNVTHYCLALQDTVLLESLVLQGLLSVAPCQLALSSALRVDNHDLNLELGQSCRPPRLSGTLTHSFPSLHIRGLPLSTSMEASAPGGVGQTGALLIKAGPCHIRARGTMGPKGRTKWSWATESECPFLQTLGLPSQAHLNGSVGQDDQSVWTAAVDAGVEGERGSLRLTAGARPGLRLEGKLSHNLASLTTIPGQARLLVTGRAGALGYDTEAQLQLGRCGVGASGTVMTGHHLQGVLVYHNNCTVLQEWGSPSIMTASGSLVVNVTVLETQVSMAMDDKELQASMAVRTSEGQTEVSALLNHSVPLLTRAGLPGNAAMAMLSENHGNGSYHQLLHCSIGRQQLTEVMTVERTAAMASVKGYLNHTIIFLRNRGVPENNRIQLEVGAGEGKSLTLRSQFGAQQAGLGVRLRALALTMELQAHLRHSWRWLQKRGLPLTVEALCSIRGPLPQMRSRARLSLDGHGLLSSSLNISLAEGHLAMLFSLASPTSTSTGWQQSVDADLTAQLTGPLKSVLAEVRRGDKQLRLSGDLRGWGTRGGSREARVMLLHSVQGQARPALQVEAWGRLTDSQLRCSMAVNPKLSSSLALIVQGYHLKDSKELMVKVVQNLPELQPYLPVQLNARSQLNQSSSGVGALLELASGSRRLWAMVDLAVLEGGFRQAVELNHSFPQLKPRSVAVRTLYERGKWSHRLQHGTVYGGQEIRVAGLYSAPPHLELGDHSLNVQMAHVPRGSSLDVTLVRSVQGSLDSVQLGWNRHGRLEQVKLMSSRNGTSETSETRLELRQPFISTLSQLHIHTLSRTSAREQKSTVQTHLSWDSGVPMNVSLFLNKQWQNNSSKGQACGNFSPGLQAVVTSPANIEGCVSVAQEGNSYSQNAVLKWGDRSVRQGIKYQRVPGGTYTLQLEAGADNVSPVPCSSHSLLAQVHTNLKDRLEHRLQLDLCPPHPSLVWSGDHRVNVGVELLYSRTRLSVTGQPAYCSVTLGLINSSSAYSTNLTVFAESTVGNWSAEVGGNALAYPLGAGVQIQARLDRSEQVWLRGALKGRCLQTAAGYHNAQGPNEDLSLAVCVEGRRRLTLKALRRKDGAEPVTLTAVTLGIANHSLIFRARGCAHDLWEVETQVHHLGSLLRVKLLERVQKLHHVLIVFRQQSRASKLLQELSAVSLRLTQRAEALLGQREGGAWAVWSSSHLRHALADSLPRLLVLLEHISRLGQQELKRPLATLAGAYHDVTGQRVEAVWRGVVEVQTAKLMELLSPVLQSHQLRLLAQTGLFALGTGLDLVSQQTAHWVEGRLAASLSGLRRRLSSIYRLSPSQCSVSVTVALPLTRSSWSRVGEAGLVEVLLEEGLLKPLQALSSLRPTAELYRLKRRIMDSPFGHQALLVADQFGVTFDGHVFELPAHCPLLLAHDIYDSSFTVLLNTEDSLHTLVVASNNSTATIHQNGQVKVNCHGIQTSYSDNGLVIKKDLNVVEVSNQDGMSVSCDPLFGVCSITLDGWLHGVSSGLLGTNDNEAGNDFTLPDGLQADNIADFVHSWQVRPECGGEPTLAEPCSKTASDPVSCHFLFSAPDSPLGSCFRVVDPAQFLRVCERSHCGSVPGPSRGPCRLAAAFVHICQRNYVPLELPVQCFAL